MVPCQPLRYPHASRRCRHAGKAHRGNLGGVYDAVEERARLAYGSPVRLLRAARAAGDGKAGAVLHADGDRPQVEVCGRPPAAGRGLLGPVDGVVDRDAHGRDAYPLDASACARQHEGPSRRERGRIALVVELELEAPGARGDGRGGAEAAVGRADARKACPGGGTDQVDVRGHLGDHLDGVVGGVGVVEVGAATLASGTVDALVEVGGRISAVKGERSSGIRTDLPKRLAIRAPDAVDHDVIAFVSHDGIRRYGYAIAGGRDGDRASDLILHVGGRRRPKEHVVDGARYAYQLSICIGIAAYPDHDGDACRHGRNCEARAPAGMTQLDDSVFMLLGRLPQRSRDDRLRHLVPLRGGQRDA